MSEWFDSSCDRELRLSAEAIGSAVKASIDAQRPGDLPSAEETRELLGLFARLPSEDLRRAVLDLLRIIVRPAA